MAEILTKKEVRIQFKKLRESISEDQIQDWSIELANQFLKLPIWDKHVFHVFLPIIRHKEVDTEPILSLLQGKDKEIVISKSNFEDRSMTHFLLTDNTKIAINEYGIPEPVSGLKISPDQIDVVLVPLLAFDEVGNRIGYGKGFYDKFLSECKPETFKIGLSFFEATNSWQDVFPTDIRLDFCITPEKIYQFLK